MTLELTLTAPAAALTCDAGTDDDGRPRRTISGQAVPWNTTARVSGGQLVRFEPGSVTLEGAAVVRDHDTTRPIGVVRSEAHTDTGAEVAAYISATPSGDEALILAADGVLTGWSVGVNADEYRIDDDGPEPIVVVARATARELSLLVNPAYGDSSRVTSVAATAGTITEPEGTTAMDTTTAPAEISASFEPPAEIVAHAPVARVVAEPELTASAYVVEAILAQRGDHAAMSTIEAALSSQVTGDNLGVIPTQYVDGILGGYDPYRPVYDSLGHGTLPKAGNDLVRPKWTTLPKVAKHSVENAQAPTGAVSIGNVKVSKESWAHAVLASIALIDRSDPGYAAEYYRAAAQSFYAEHEADLAAVVVAAAPDPGAAIAEPLAALADAVKASVLAQTVSGVFVGYWPTWALVGMDVWGALVSEPASLGPAYGTGTATVDSPQGVVSGITVRACPTIDPALVIAGHPIAATAYMSSAVDLRALVVNTMSVELGFYTDTAVMVNNDAVLGTATVGSAPAGRSSK